MVTTIDCHYLKPQLAAAYLLHCGPKACFIDNNTSRALPYLLAALKQAGYTPDAVEYIIITHVHLDHAGCTGALLQHCPQAKVVAHPRAAPHLINPERLIRSAESVYGPEEFRRLFGEIVPVPEEKIIIPQDGDILRCGDNELQFIYTRGHANHHFAILDRTTKSVFTGDTFGIAYPQLQHGSTPFVFPSTSPTDFDAAEALQSYQKILTCGAQRAYLTHFGVLEDIQRACAMLVSYTEFAAKLLQQLLQRTNYSGAENYQFAHTSWKNFFAEELARRGIAITPEIEELLAMDCDLNAQGLVFVAERARRKTAHA